MLFVVLYWVVVRCIVLVGLLSLVRYVSVRFFSVWWFEVLGVGL